MRHLFAFLALLLAATPALAEGDPLAAARARSQALVQAFESVKKDGDARTNAKAYATLDGMLDFGWLTDQALEPRKEKFTAAQRKEFQQIFEKLVREMAYPNSGDFFRGADVTMGEPRKQGEVVVVPYHAWLEKEDLEMEVGIHWRDFDGTLKLADVSFDGDSLVLDYRNQFTALVDKEGPDGLIARAKAKLEELQQGAKQQGAEK